MEGKKRGLLDRARRLFFPTKEELFTEYSSWLEAERMHALFVETGRQGGLKSAPTKRAQAEARKADKMALDELRTIAKTAQLEKLKALAKERPEDILFSLAQKEDEKRETALLNRRLNKTYRSRKERRWRRVSPYLHQVRAEASAQGKDARTANSINRAVDEIAPYLKVLSEALRKKEPSALDARPPELAPEAGSPRARGPESLR